MAQEAHALVNSDLEVGPAATTKLNEWLGSWTNAELACNRKNCAEARYDVQCLRWAIARKAHQLLFQNQPIRVCVGGGRAQRTARITVRPSGSPKAKKLHHRVAFPRFSATPLFQASLPKVLPTFPSSCETNVKAELDRWLQECKKRQFPTRSSSHDLARNDITYAERTTALQGYGLFLGDKHVSLFAGGHISYKHSQITVYAYGKDGNYGTIGSSSSFPSLRAELLPPPDSSATVQQSSPNHPRSASQNQVLEQYFS